MSFVQTKAYDVRIEEDVAVQEEYSVLFDCSPGQPEGIDDVGCRVQRVALPAFGICAATGMETESRIATAV